MPQHSELAVIPPRDTSPGFADLLNWGSLIEDGVVLCKDGSLLAGWRVGGPDSFALAEHDRAALSERMNTALLSLGAGWAMWYDVCRLRVSDYPHPCRSAFPDRISQLVDDERRLQFTERLDLFETRHVLVLQFTASRDQVRRLSSLVYSNAGGMQSRADRLLADFAKAMVGIENILAGMLDLQRLRGYVVRDDVTRLDVTCDALIDYLDFTQFGEARELSLHPSGGYLDRIIGVNDFTVDPEAKIGQKHIGCVDIGGFPATSHPGILLRLDFLPLEYRWSTRFIFQDEHEARASIAGYERRWRQKVRSFSSQLMRVEDGRVNADAVEMVAQTREASAASSSEMTKFGFYTSVIVLLDPDPARLAENLRIVAKAITSSRFTPRIETMNTPAAWLGTIPGLTVRNCRRPLVSTRNLADFLALQSLWNGEPEHECSLYPPHAPPLLHAVTTGDTPFRFSLHVGDVGHTLIFGPTGAGKTFLMCTLLMQALRYPRMQIWAFDFKRGIRAAVKACRGEHYDIGSGSGPSFCPLGMLDTPDDVAFAEDWLATCFELQAHRLPQPGETREIHRAVELLRTSTKRTVSDFVDAVQDPAVKEALSYYTLTGSTGRMLDAEHDGLRDGGHLLCFETEDFLAYPEATRLPIMLYLFRRFERSLDGRPAMLMLSEAWSVLGNTVFARKLGVWLRTLRSKNCAVVLETQSLADALRSDVAALLNESCQTKIFLPNSRADQHGTADNPGPRDLYRMLGLTDDDVAVIRGAVPKREYFAVSDRGRRLFWLSAGPVLRAFAGASSKEALARTEALEGMLGTDWPEQWLAEQGASR